MKILLVVAYYLPEIGSAAHIYSDLATSFSKLGHEVHIITTYPREYNLLDLDKNRVWKLDEVIDGVNVHRVKYTVDRNNIVDRGLEHFLIINRYFKCYKKLDIKFDSILMYIPPLPLYYLAKKIKRYDGTKSILNFQDFHPQELTDVQIMKNPFYIKVMEYIEREAYRNSDFITVLTRGAVNYVVDRGADPTKVMHIYNSVNLNEVKNYSERKDFKEKQGIEDKFLITYAGILSPYQGIDKILDTAKQLKKYEDIIFYIVGDGSIKNHLEKRVKNERIMNVKLLPFQSRNEYFNIVNSSEVSIVSLDERMKAPCLPGKIMNILSMGKPIIANVNANCETACVIKESGGILVPPENNIELGKAILNLKEDHNLYNNIEINEKRFCMEHMNLEKNIEQYLKLFELLSDNEL